MKYSDLDVVEINDVTFVSNDKHPSLFMQILIFIGQLIFYTIIVHFRYKPLPSQYKGIVFLGVSLNNQRSLNPIADHLDKDEFIYLKDHKTDINKRRAFWLSVPYLPSLIRKYKASDNKTKSVIKNFFTRLWSTYGYYQLAEEYLEHYQVKVLVVSSDHGEFHRCLLIRAKEMGIKTIYVQHASIAKGFPRLIASYSFLDGKESLEKYLYSGQPEGQVYLSGGVRFDPIFKEYKLKNVEKVSAIGIAINMLDNFDKVKSLCDVLLGQGYQLLLRPHPRYGGLDTNWLSEKGIDFSNPKMESSFDFISKIDLMISNESSIHLDSALMHCPSVVYNFSNNPILDFYSYIKSGLTQIAHDEQQLITMLSTPKSLLPSATTLQYFNASCGTKLEGQLGKMIATFIYAIASNQDPALDDTFGFHQSQASSIHTP